jgi:hypothetical protein
VPTLTPIAPASATNLIQDFRTIDDTPKTIALATEFAQFSQSKLCRLIVAAESPPFIDCERDVKIARLPPLEVHAMLVIEE